MTPAPTPPLTLDALARRAPALHKKVQAGRISR